MDKIVKYQKAQIIIPKCEIKRVGLIFDKSISYDEWGIAGHIFNQIEGSNQWWIGDWLKEGKKRFERGKYNEAVEKTGFSKTTIRHSEYVSIRIPIESGRRRPPFLLSWTHHQEVAPHDPSEQDRWLDKAEEENWTVKELRRAIRESKIERPDPLPSSKGLIYKKDALEFLAGLGDKSADLLLTDPPYMTDLDDVTVFATKWVPIALSKIKASGRAYIFTGAYPIEVQAYLAVLLAQDDFILDNILIWTYRNTMGPSPKMGYKLNWQAIFYLYGSDAVSLNCPRLTEQFTVHEFSQPFSGDEPRYSTWQKPSELAEMFIRHSTKKDDLIIDPFAGTGTFIIQAIKMGRKAIGAEIDDKMIKVCKKRGLTID